MILRRIARPMLASVFVYSGIDSLRNPTHRADVARDFVNEAVDKLPDEATAKVPTDPETLVRINGAIQVGSGLLLATGKFPRVAASTLAVSLVPTTVAGHAFWEETDPAKRAQQRTQFLKNLSLLGGLLITAADTEGKPSLAWRGKKKAGAAGDAIAAALPIGAAAGTSTWESLRERTHEGAEVLGERSSEAGEYVKEGAHLLSERSAEAAAKIREHAPEIAEAARERSADAAAKFQKHAPEIADAARERSAELAEKAADAASVVADRIRDRAPEVADAARERSSGLARFARKRGPEIADTARERSADLADAARAKSNELADLARTKGPQVAEVARGKGAELADAARERSADVAASARALAASASDTADEGRRRWRKARS